MPLFFLLNITETWENILLLYLYAFFIIIYIFYHIIFNCFDILWFYDFCVIFFLKRITQFTKNKLNADGRTVRKYRLSRVVRPANKVHHKENQANNQAKNQANKRFESALCMKSAI